MRLEGDDSAGRPDQLPGEDREVADVRADDHESHSGSQRISHEPCLFGGPDAGCLEIRPHDRVIRWDVQGADLRLDIRRIA
jgi:hypothetical protein